MSPSRGEALDYDGPCSCGRGTLKLPMNRGLGKSRQIESNLFYKFFIRVPSFVNVPTRRSDQL